MAFLAKLLKNPAKNSIKNLRVFLNPFIWFINVLAYYDHFETRHYDDWEPYNKDYDIKYFKWEKLKEKR